MRLWIIEEVGPVWVSLHVPELEQLSDTQSQDVEADLKEKTNIQSAEKKHMPDCTRFCFFVVFSVLTELGSAKKGMSAVEKAPLHKLTCVIITIRTSFFSS